MFRESRFESIHVRAQDSKGFLSGLIVDPVNPPILLTQRAGGISLHAGWAAPDRLQAGPPAVQVGTCASPASFQSTRCGPRRLESCELPSARPALAQGLTNTGPPTFLAPQGCILGLEGKGGCGEGCRQPAEGRQGGAGHQPGVCGETSPTHLAEHLAVGALPPRLRWPGLSFL